VAFGLRTFLEFADTTCGDVSFSATDKPNYGCGYEKDTWKAGYRYRGRVIGDSMDRDGRRFTIGLIYGDPGGLSWDVRVRHFDLNRGGIAQAGLVPQTVTRTAEKLWNSEFEIHGRIGPFYSGAGIGADYGGPPGAPASTAGRVFVNLSRPW